MDGSPGVARRRTALAATEGVAAAVVHDDPDADLVALDEPAARVAVTTYLRQVGAQSHFSGLTATVDVVDDVLIVRLRTHDRLPFPVPGAPSYADIEAIGSATMPIY